MQFTEQQLRAIDIERLGQDMCVVAGPGSGKTTVLVERFRRLVREAGMSPARILAITFTEKAATNMKQKLAEAFRDRPEDRRQIERAYVSTVHGFCMRLLRENAIFAGIDPEFRILDERQAGTMAALAVSEALDSLLAENPEPMRRLMQGIGGVGLSSALQEVYDAVRSSGAGLPEEAVAPAGISFAEAIDRARSLAHVHATGWSPAQKLALGEVISWGERYAHLRQAPVSHEHFHALGMFRCALRGMKRGNPLYDRVKTLKAAIDDDVYRSLLTEYYAAERATLLDLLRRFDEIYRQRKQAAAALDYSDLEEVTVRLLEENGDVRERIRAQFDQVLMDEFQDTNGLQAKLLELVRPPDRFYAVGDINQSIYGFRHAEPAVFRGYRDAVERAGKPLAELTENWRSRRAILDTVTAVMRGAAGIEERPLIGAQQFADKAEPSVEVLAALGTDIEAALDLEARWVAHRILELEGNLALRKRTAGFGDIAVLVRNSEVMASFAAVFEEAGIPYLVGRGRGFYEVREITDLIHLLRVVVNARDEISMAAVLRSPLVGISDEALLRLKQVGNLGEAVRLPPLGLEAADQARLERFRENLREWRALKDTVTADRLLQRALDAAGHHHEPGSRAAANVEKFLSMARAAAERLTLAQFVEELELLRESDPRDTDAPPEDSTNAVRILTVHAAKGLEFPVVFLAAMHKGMDTGLGDVSFSPRIGLGTRWRNPETGEEKDDGFQYAIRQERKQREAEEGNRLLYVAMTRAEEHLVMSFSRAATAPKHWAEMLQQALPVDLQTAGEPRVETIGEGVPVRVQVTAARPELLRRQQEQERRPAPERLDPPRVEGQYDSNATVTSVSLFAACPRRYYLERYLRAGETDFAQLKGDADDRLPASEFGLQVHALLADLPVERPHAEAVRLASQFRATPLGKRAARAQRMEREYDFLLALEDVVLRGQIDLWFEDRGELILVDYKTDAVVGAQEAAEHATAYEEQLRLYALALERAMGRLPDSAYLCFLRCNESVPVDLSPLALQGTVNLVREFRDAQEHLQFPLRTGAHCRRCRFLGNLCPAEMLSLS
jgi:ATP-dependent exoDNAse (exonuclease V) beta subunit